MPVPGYGKNPRMIEKPSKIGEHLELKRDLGVWSAAAIVVGTVIGSGIFLVPNAMVKNVGSPGMGFAVWIFGGILTLFGALSYAELAAALPQAGGEYVYLRESYGPLWGFLYGWTSFLVIQTGTIAAVAVAFAKFFGVLVPQLGRDAVFSRLENLKINWALPPPWMGEPLTFFKR